MLMAQECGSKLEILTQLQHQHLLQGFNKSVPYRCKVNVHCVCLYTDKLCILHIANILTHI